MNIPFSWALVTPPASEALSLADAKAFLRVDSAAEDATIGPLISAARDYLEGQTGRTLMPTVYRWTLDRFPLTPGLQVGMPAIPVPPVNTSWPLDPGAWALDCPRAPLLSVASLQYIDTGGNLNTLDPSMYTVDGDSEPPRLAPVAGTPWPSVQFGPRAVRIQLTCGYSDATLIPPSLKQVMRMLVAHYYLNREAVTQGTLVPVPMAVEAILGNWRLPYM